jgi:hypothetical protein
VSVDLSRFELITVVSGEDWNKLRLQKMTMVNLPPALSTIGYGAFFSCKELVDVNFASLTSALAEHREECILSLQELGG